MRLSPEAFRRAALASPETTGLLAAAVARAREAHPTLTLGPLSRWLRAGVSRALIDARRRKSPERLLEEDDWLAWPSLADDPELCRLKRTCRDAFKRAATEALAALAPRARLLMRQHLLDGVGVAQLATMYGVHTATAYRRLEQAREQLVRETRRRLSTYLQLDVVEIDRLLGLPASELDVSVRRLLGAE